MKIDDDHLYHGAALIQIAEDTHFTAINSLKLSGHALRAGYKINNDIAVYFKYASKPAGKYKEYVFTFSNAHLAELSEISRGNPKTLITLVCVKDREICCLTYSELQSLRSSRKNASGKEESNLTVLVTIPKGKSMRVYVNTPGKRNSILGKPIVKSRNAFPSIIFDGAA